MTSRVLPPSEWNRLAGTELETLWPSFNPSCVQVLVVEDDGAIVACWALLNVLHCEGAWVHPAHQGRAAAIRHLLHGMGALVQEAGGHGVLTASASPSVSRLLKGLGGEKLDVEHYALNLERWIVAPKESAVCH